MLYFAAALFLALNPAIAADLEWIRVGEDGRSFALDPSGRRFIAWGFNYDHDETGRLIEEYWESEWTKVEEDFREMKDLGANVVRVHLQLGRFMNTADSPNQNALNRLARLVELAETVGLYLDLTGLGCYHKDEVPVWYDAMDEEQRWATQARFWEAIAARCAKSPAIFCYDLMNEPVVPGGRGKQENWLGPEFGNKYFTQFITRETKGRPRPDVARQWIGQLAAAIRKHDRRHMITVGMVDWSLDRPGLTSGFVPQKVSGDLDFIAVHLYPAGREIDEALETLKGFAVGKPVVIEEMFTLKCSAKQLGEFIDESKTTASGWIGFYWGKTPEQLRSARSFANVFMLSWLELFQEKGKTILE